MARVPADSAAPPSIPAPGTGAARARRFALFVTLNAMRSPFYALCLGGLLYLANACSAPGSTSPPPPSGAAPLAGPLTKTTKAQPALAAHPLFAGDSLARLFRPGAKIIQAHLVGDTLLLVATSDFIYYSFGKCGDIACLQKRCAPLVFKVKDEALLQTKGGYTGRFRRSYVQGAQTVEQDTLMALVAGKLCDPGIAFANGITVGMDRAQLLRVFFKAPLGTPTSQIKVVRLDSGLDGMNHYYTFGGDTLQTIKLVSLLGSAFGK